jgi:hypothetical protein
MASSAMHGLVFLFGFWLLAYRHRGINTKIFKELYVTVGTGVRPKPVSPSNPALHSSATPLLSSC